MDSKQIILQFLNEKFAGDENIQQKINDFVLDTVAEALIDSAEVQTWLKAKKAQLEASKTPEALEAEKLALEQRLTSELQKIDELVVVDAKA